MEQFNIFRDILSYENNVSSLLVNLSNYDLFKKELVAFLGLELDYKNVEMYTEVDLRVEKNHFGRIDIMIYDNEEDEYLVENKITNYRSLTKNQEEEGYLDYIKSNKNAKKLIFLLPKNYEHIKNIQSMRDNNENKLVIKYWQDFVKHFKQSGIYELNPFIRELIDFLEDWFVSNRVKFSYNEIKIIKNDKDVMMNDAKIATIMKKLIKIVEDINIKREPRKKADEYGGYGYKIDNNKYNLHQDMFVWYGIDYDIWEKYGSPLMIWVNDVDGIKEVLNNDKFLDYHYDGEEALIFLFENLSSENIKDEIEEKIAETIDKLKKIKKID